MVGDLKLLHMASAMARHAAERHRILAENIANADTSGYKAKDIEPFTEAFTRSMNGIGDQGGLSSNDADIFTWRVVNVAGPGLMSPNGNSVSLEDQMMRSVEAQQSHDAATAIYKKTIDILRLSLGRKS
jgi:flagellar basal-body rod protein FlgB